MATAGVHSASKPFWDREPLSDLIFSENRFVIYLFLVEKKYIHIHHNHHNFPSLVFSVCMCYFCFSGLLLLGQYSIAELGCFSPSKNKMQIRNVWAKYRLFLQENRYPYLNVDPHMKFRAVSSCSNSQVTSGNPLQGTRQPREIITLKKTLIHTLKQSGKMYEYSFPTNHLAFGVSWYLLSCSHYLHILHLSSFHCLKTFSWVKKIK